jgi:type IV pilus assembly protein PilA
MKAQRGFTMLELTSVVGIIGTVASLAVPAYQDYIARAQVAEALQLASAARTVVTEHYATYGEWPASLPDAALQSAKYTSGIALVAGEGSYAATLTATLKTTGVHHDIQGKAIRFETTDGGATWVCGAADISERVLPQACRS